MGGGTRLFQLHCQVQASQGNKNADTLSRFPTEKPESEEDEWMAVSCDHRAQATRSYKTVMHPTTVSELMDISQRHDPGKSDSE